MDAATLAWSAGTAALTAVVTGSRAGGQPRGDAAAGPCDDGHEGSLLQCFAAHAFSDAASALCTVNLASYLLFVCTWALSYAGCGALRQEEREQLQQNFLEYAGVKLLLLPIFIEPTLEDAATWLGWFAAMGQLKVLVMLARDRIKLLGSALPGRADRLGCVRVAALLVLVTAALVLWVLGCCGLSSEIGTQLVLIMLFDSLCVAFELAQLPAGLGIARCVFLYGGRGPVHLGPALCNEPL
jgi:hypothetical protein